MAILGPGSQGGHLARNIRLPMLPDSIDTDIENKYVGAQIESRVAPRGY